MGLLLCAIAYVKTDAHFEVSGYTWVCIWFVVFTFDQIYSRRFSLIYVLQAAAIVLSCNLHVVILTSPRFANHASMLFASSTSSMQWTV